VDVTVVSGLLVFAGGYWSLTVLQWLLWVFAFQILLIL